MGFTSSGGASGGRRLPFLVAGDGGCPGFPAQGFDAGAPAPRHRNSRRTFGTVNQSELRLYLVVLVRYEVLLPLCWSLA